MGTAADGIQQKIADEMRQKFPGVTASTVPTTEPSDVVLYAFLQKNLPFAARYDSLREPLTFHAPSGDVRVKAFGFTKLKDARNNVGGQTVVLNYVSDDEFVIQLNSTTDQIILAKVPPAATLAESLADVRRRIATPEKSRPTAEGEDTLSVPTLAFNVLRNYHELKKARITNYFRGGFPWYEITDAKQSVRFLLNEKGARIESEAFESLIGGNGHEPPPPPKPRKFILDRPFLLYVKEPEAQEPYLVLWVASAEFMQRFDGR
jgi:hypothetical protein